MKYKKETHRTKISLVIGLVWLVLGLLLTILDPGSLFFTLILGSGILFTTYMLYKTQILL